jgi:DNA-binding HxlR family transcriptional regulator
VGEARRAPAEGEEPAGEKEEVELAQMAGGAPSGGPDLDRLIHERVRLGIVSALAVNETLSFNDLKALLKVTDGNLSAHARKLEDAGYLKCIKGYEGRVPHTEYRLTSEGRAALEGYLGHMEALIHAVRDG